MFCPICKYIRRTGPGLPALNLNSLADYADIDYNHENGGIEQDDENVIPDDDDFDMMMLFEDEDYHEFDYTDADNDAETEKLIELTNEVEDLERLAEEMKAALREDNGREPLSPPRRGGGKRPSGGGKRRKKQTGKAKVKSEVRRGGSSSVTLCQLMNICDGPIGGILLHRH